MINKLSFDLDLLTKSRLSTVFTVTSSGLYWETSNLKARLVKTRHEVDSITGVSASSHRSHPVSMGSSNSPNMDHRVVGMEEVRHLHHQQLHCLLEHLKII
jgi:hypothetical protein